MLNAIYVAMASLKLLPNRVQERNGATFQLHERKLLHSLECRAINCRSNHYTSGSRRTSEQHVQGAKVFRLLYRCRGGKKRLRFLSANSPSSRPRSPRERKYGDKLWKKIARGPSSPNSYSGRLFCTRSSKCRTNCRRSWAMFWSYAAAEAEAEALRHPGTEAYQATRRARPLRSGQWQEWR